MSPTWPAPTTSLLRLPLLASLPTGTRRGTPQRCLRPFNPSLFVDSSPPGATPMVYDEPASMQLGLTSRPTSAKLRTSSRTLSLLASQTRLWSRALVDPTLLANMFATMLLLLTQSRRTSLATSTPRPVNSIVPSVLFLPAPPAPLYVALLPARVISSLQSPSAMPATWSALNLRNGNGVASLTSSRLYPAASSRSRTALDVEQSAALTLGCPPTMRTSSTSPCSTLSSSTRP